MPPKHAAAPNEAQLASAIIVEDDEEMRALLRSLVLQLGFKQIAGFARPEPAMDRLEYDAFGLGIVDLNLGDRDGVSLIQAIRSNPRACVNSMPVLVASTASTGDRIQSAISAGADGFLSKPFSITNLKRQIQFAHTKAEARLARFALSHAQVGLPGPAHDVLELD